MNDEEKETLRREVLTELGRQVLKKEIVKELKPVNWKTSLAQLAKHPAFLLLIGFALTGIIGSRLTSSWQRREWDRQQTRLITLKSTEQMYAFMDDVLKLEAQNQLQVMAIWKPILNGVRRDPIELMKDKERLEQERVTWGFAANTLEKRVKIFFRNSDVHTALYQVFESRRGIHQRLEEMLDGRDSNGKVDHPDDFMFKQGSMWDFAIENSDRLTLMIEKMTSEIRHVAEGH